ncbi:hypothetical protein [Kitasatospora azatica]|uniref:hypothetical protein n=1 Tax=Kitasatospora azatica TaxID=58347 RepID=UPI000567476E|nr:hypothetical protein [Kitasatospora azatica]
MGDHHEDTLEALSSNAAAPSSVLLRLLQHDGRSVRTNVAKRGGLPAEVVEAILAHPEREVRAAFAESWTADPAQRARLLDDPSGKLSLLLAMGPMPYRTRVEPLPDWAYQRLLTHPREMVRHETVASPSIPAHVLAGLADHPDPVFRRASCLAWDELSGSARQALLQDDDLDVRWAAGVRVCHQVEGWTGWLLENTANSWRRDEVLRVGLLDRDLAERLVAEGEQLPAVAANPSLPPHLVRQLAVHPAPRVRLVVSARAELTEQERAAIDYTVGPEARLGVLDWVWDAREDVEVLRQCATSAHPWLRRSAAVCPALPPDLVELLARDEDFAVRLLLCEWHPQPPPELLLDLYLNGRHRAVRMLIANPRFPTAGLAARFAQSPDPDRRRLALRDPALGLELLDRLSRDPETQHEAARHPLLPLPRIRELLADPVTASAAAGNPSLPVEDMHRLLDRAGVPGRGAGQD